MAWKAPAFQMYAKDIYTGTSDLSSAEFGVYVRGLVWSWDNGGLPLDADRRARVLLCTAEELATLWPAIEHLWQRESHGFTNARLEDERQKQADYRVEQARRGRLGGRPRTPTENRSVSPGFLKTKAKRNRTVKPEQSSASASASASALTDQDHGDAVASLVRLWNDLTTPPIPKCEKLTAARKQRALARLRDRPLAEWRDVIERIEASAFCRGDSKNGWRASFDWLLQPDVATKTLEGQYDRPKTNAGPSRPRVNWFEDCEDRHGGRCRKQADHWARVKREEEDAGRPA